MCDVGHVKLCYNLYVIRLGERNQYVGHTVFLKNVTYKHIKM